MNSNGWTTRKAEAFVREWKQTHACMDCGRFYPYYVLEFDHVPGMKRLTLGHSREIRRLTEAELRIEISRTDVVCRNCHAEREHQRRQNASQSGKRGQ